MSSTVYNILLVLHIIAVTLWLGANFSMGVAANRTVGASNEINAWWAGVQGLMGKTMKNAAFILLLITGIGMVSRADDGIEFKSAFVSVGFLVVVIGGALGGMVFALITGWLIDHYSYVPVFLLFGTLPLASALVLWFGTGSLDKSATAKTEGTA